MRPEDKRAGARERAFTIIELLVVVAAISVLIGVLAPALSGARAAAQRAACAAIQKRLAVGLLHYAASNDEWLPGYNTSGAALWTADPDPRIIKRLSLNPSAPVQTNDWISPSTAGEGLPENREHRFYALLDIYADPAMRERVPAWIAGGRGNLEMADWTADNTDQPAHGVSYLMPANFQLFGGDRAAGRVTQNSSVSLKELRRQHQLPAIYKPRIDLLGAASRKVAFADGFRYISFNQFDSDFSYHASFNWGSFTDRSACSIESTPWGYKGGDGAGLGVPLSFRHTGAMNAAFWDGHVQSLTQRQSRHPAIWVPTGSTFVGNRNSTYAESFDYGYKPVIEDPSRAIVE